MANPFPIPVLSFQIYNVTVSVYMTSIFVSNSQSYDCITSLFLLYMTEELNHVNNPAACDQISDAKSINLSEIAVFKSRPRCASLYK